MFFPRRPQNWKTVSNDNKYFDPKKWTYLYDHYPLAKNLDRYVDHSKLNLAATKEELPDVLRIMITTVNVMTTKPLVFNMP